ncbi:MAG: glycosyltransferase family 2 protein [bacterium]
MNTEDKHTFVIMGYGESPYLEESYNALKNQTVKSRIIMTSSTPNEYQERFAERNNIPLIINPNRQGFAGDLNFAYASASTDYVTMVHQDDLLMPEYAEQCIKYADKYPDTLIVFTDYVEYYNGKMNDESLNMKVKKVLLKTHFPFINNLKSKIAKRSLLSFGNPISCPSIFYIKKNIGDFGFKHEYKVSPEWEALVRLSRMDGRFVYVKNKLHAYRVHSGQITSVGLEHRKREDKLVFNLLWPKPIASLLIKFYSYCYSQVPDAEANDKI